MRLNRRQSLRGQYFVTASGDELPNYGDQEFVGISCEGVDEPYRAAVADVERTLFSVGEECDKGQVWIFGQTGRMALNTLTGTVRASSAERTDSTT